MESLFSAFSYILNNYAFLATLYTTSFFVKTYLFVKVIKAKKQHYAWFFLLIAIGSLIVSNDIIWLMWLSRRLFPGLVSILVMAFARRVAWVFSIFFYLSLTLLIESLQEEKYLLRWYNKAFILFYGILAGLFVYIAFFYGIDPPPLEFMLIKIFTRLQPIIILCISLVSLLRMRKSFLPKILIRQLYSLISVFIIPAMIFDEIQYICSLSSLNEITDQPLIACLSTLLLTCALYYTLNKILNLRFLNSSNHVDSSDKFNFVIDFAETVNQVSQAVSFADLNVITRDFFDKALKVPEEKAHLFLRNVEQSSEGSDDRISIVERFLNAKGHVHFVSSLHVSKILIYDEIVFSHFYKETVEHKAFIAFLDELNADVFVPIYHHQDMMAYIIVERSARKELYTNLDRDEMIIFANFLGKVIYFMQHKNFEALVADRVSLKQELFSKHQEVNQYKESTRSFLRLTKEHNIGILFYKNRKFEFGNQAAQDLIGINMNAQEGHPLSKKCREIARYTEEYRVPQRAITADAQGNRLVLSSLPNLERNNVIIIVHYPEITDILKDQLDRIKDPSELDYLLYLETTKSGQLIKRLIPDSGPTFLSFKIELLKIALSKKATLLDVPEEDVGALVDILHHISLRQQLYTLKLTVPVKSADVGIKLFGLNPIFGSTQSKPVLEQLHEIGTLYIQNVHFLDLESQENLAHLIKYGSYTLVRSEQKIEGNVRIICSTNQDLQALVRESRFSFSLYQELQKASLVMPALSVLPEKELVELADSYAEQMVQTTNQTGTFKDVFEFTEREKGKIVEHRPVSLFELKDRIQTLLIQKSKKNNIFDEIKFNPALHHTDPELVHAAQLGRRALRDAKIMTTLWQKCNKNQSKIAALLGVDRSSVYKRYKALKLNGPAA